MRTVPVERLEGRRLCSAATRVGGGAASALAVDETAPVLQAVRFIGPPGQATAVALTFSTPLDPAGATNLLTYEFFMVRRLTHFISPRMRMPLASASYDDATRT
jgi:hypothetical protein